MCIMPLITRSQPRMFDNLIRILPYRLVCSLRAIDELHASARNGLSRKKPVRLGIRSSLFLIFIDAIVLVTIMFVLNITEDFVQAFVSRTSIFFIPGEVLLLIAMIIIVSPVVYNMFYNVRKIAEELTAVSMESPRNIGRNRLAVYKVFANLAYVAMVFLVIMIIIPLLPNVLILGPIGQGVALAAGIVILILIWDALRNVYAEFCALVLQRPEDEEKNDE